MPDAALQKIADDVEEDAQRRFDREVQADWIGRQVMRHLRDLDQVAYVRFASVYHRFATIEELMGEIQQVMHERGDDPGQGSLFSRKS